MGYYPKRPVKSFQDLEVYQKALAIAVVVTKNIDPLSLRGSEATEAIPSKLLAFILSLPTKIASAHSLRFSDQHKAVELLEEAMLNCNLAIAHLELYRDLRSKDQDNSGSGTIEVDFFETQIKNLLSLRMKILHLQMSWKKFSQQKTYEK